MADPWQRLYSGQFEGLGMLSGGDAQKGSRQLSGGLNGDSPGLRASLLPFARRGMTG